MLDVSPATLHADVSAQGNGGSDAVKEPANCKINFTNVNDALLHPGTVSSWGSALGQVFALYHSTALRTPSSKGVCGS